ncbi:MAG: PHP domain-containing protein, partial [Clostridia bacterium]|nr:PHP domain-containing protein [Clostridia bacterium]
SGAISAYAYLGDVGDSVTGDKKAQKFEDDYLPLLFDTLKELGFDAVTYMPTRNTEDQLKRVMSYCDRYNLFQISGVDINSPRQEFICRQLDNPLYAHLVDATYALIGAENEASKDLNNAMFSDKTILETPSVKDRIAYYKTKA